MAAGAHLRVVAQALGRVQVAAGGACCVVRSGNLEWV